MHIKIKILDNIQAQVIQGKEIIKPILSFPASYFRQVQFRKIRTEYNKCLMFGKGNFLIYNGWINRIQKFANSNNHTFELIGEIEQYNSDKQPFLNNITFRDWQIEAIDVVLKKQRGIINGATGTGKTKFSLGLISCFNNPKVLYITPSLDLMNQTHDGFIEHGFKACKLGDGIKEITEDIVVSTMQTFVNLDLIALSDRFDIVIVDEAQLAVKSSGTIEKILSINLAPIRIALTGTPPKEKEKKLILEGLTGEIIYDIGANVAIEKGILMNPKIKLLKVPTIKDVRFSTYQEWYKFGIVDNKVRNNIIVNQSIEYIKQNKNVIIFVKEIAHLNNITELLDLKNVDFEEVHGIISSEDRNRIKKKILAGKCRCVVSSVVWMTGIDIPNLDVGILAAGGKSETQMIQAIGRILRKSEGKEESTIIDFLDCYRYLAEHCIQRISVYNELGWI